jgi:predicted NBD/HSP70 family sugar kinase
MPPMSQVGATSLPTAADLAHVLGLFREAEALTRADVMRLSGLSRSTVNQRIDTLLTAELVRPAGGQSIARGRPPERFAFNSNRGVLLVADMGATSLRTGLCDLSGKVLAEHEQAIDLTQGPEALLTLIKTAFVELLIDAGLESTSVLGIGLDVPGPVDFARGRVVSPPILNGWDGFDIRGWFGHHFTCPVLVENDVNAMAWGEHQTVYPDVTELFLLKLGTGIGAGLVTRNRIFRGADGSAGDIGHYYASPPDDAPVPQCRCGRLGCVEAYAGGWALVRDLNEAGTPTANVDQAVQLLRSGDLTAVRLARRSGRIVGEAIAQAVSLFNPRVIVLAGQLAAAEEHLIAGIREVVYQRSLPLATRNLQIRRSELADRAGLIGLALQLADTIFAGPEVELLVAAKDSTRPSEYARSQPQATHSR